MQIIDLYITEIRPGTSVFRVDCLLKGDLGEAEESLEYVIKNYGVSDT
jgi:hypothetical protein